MTAVLGVLATAYGIGGAFAILLQARRMLVVHASCEISIPFLVIYEAGDVIWLAYGAALPSAALIISDGANLACGAVTLGIALAFHRACAPAPDEDSDADLAEYDEARAYRGLA